MSKKTIPGNLADSFYNKSIKRICQSKGGNHMKKLIKKVFVICIVAATFFLFCPVMPTEAANTSGSFNERISQLQKKFPNGKYWNHMGKGANDPNGYTSTPCTHHGHCSAKGYNGWCGCNSFNNQSIQCFGFAEKLGYDVFGTNPSRTWTKSYNLSNVRAGDIIRYKNNGHSIFVTKVSGNTITYADCNSDGHCKIRWNATISKSSVYGLSYVQHANNYSDVMNIRDSKPAAPQITAMNAGGIINPGNSFSARIRNCASGKYLTDRNSNVDIESRGDEKLGEQIWKFERNSDGSYYIHSSITGMVMDVESGDKDALNIYLNNNYQLQNQRWFIHQRADGSVYFRPANSTTKVLDIANGFTEEGTNVWEWTYNGTDAQKFAIDKCSEIQNIGEDFSALIMNTACWKPIMQRDDANVVLGTPTAENMSRILWHFVRNPKTGYYTIYSYLNGKCLDVQDAKSDCGANVWCYQEHGHVAQRWYVLRDSNGKMYLKAACSSKNLDLSNNESADGTNIQMWDYNMTNAQVFTIYQLDANRDKLNHQISASKTQVNVNEKVNISVTGALYTTSYRFHIVAPNGQESVVDNKCNPNYTFSGTQAGTYRIYAELKSPVSSETGSLSGKCVSIQVNSVQKDTKSLTGTKIYGIKTSYTYTGKSITPSVIIYNNKTRLKKGKDYIVTCQNNVNMGKATVTIQGKGKYSGTVKKTFRIIPNKMNRVSAGYQSGKIRVSWKKNTQVDGYEICHANNRIFIRAKKNVISKNSITTRNITGYRKGNNCYVKIRSFKWIDGKKYYGKYSAVKAVRCR